MKTKWPPRLNVLHLERLSLRLNLDFQPYEDLVIVC